MLVGRPAEQPDSAEQPPAGIEASGLESGRLIPLQDPDSGLIFAEQIVRLRRQWFGKHAVHVLAVGRGFWLGKGPTGDGRVTSANSQECSHFLGCRLTGDNLQLVQGGSIRSEAGEEAERSARARVCYMLALFCR